MPKKRGLPSNLEAAQAVGVRKRQAAAAAAAHHSQVDESDYDEMELEPEQRELEQQQSSSSRVAGSYSSSAMPAQQSFDVGDDEVLGQLDDAVGLVGCTVVLTFDGWDGAHRCHVDAFAPNAPGGAAYIVSWKAGKDWDADTCLYT